MLLAFINIYYKLLVEELPCEIAEALALVCLILATALAKVIPSEMSLSSLDKALLRVASEN